MNPGDAAQTVGNMVCPYCARLHGREHVEGCPYVRDDLTAEYEAGWNAAVAGLLPPFAEELAQAHTNIDLLLAEAKRRGD